MILRIFVDTGAGGLATFVTLVILIVIVASLTYVSFAVIAKVVVIIAVCVLAHRRLASFVITYMILRILVYACAGGLATLVALVILIVIVASLTYITLAVIAKVIVIFAVCVLAHRRLASLVITYVILRIFVDTGAGSLATFVTLVIFVLVLVTKCGNVPLFLGLVCCPRCFKVSSVGSPAVYCASCRSRLFSACRYCFRFLVGSIYFANVFSCALLSVLSPGVGCICPLVSEGFDRLVNPADLSITNGTIYDLVVTTCHFAGSVYNFFSYRITICMSGSGDFRPSDCCRSTHRALLTVCQARFGTSSSLARDGFLGVAGCCHFIRFVCVATSTSIGCVTCFGTGGSGNYGFVGVRYLARCATDITGFVAVIVITMIFLL